MKEKNLFGFTAAMVGVVMLTCTVAGLGIVWIGKSIPKKEYIVINMGQPVETAEIESSDQQ